MTIDEIKKSIREIEIYYDYNHNKNDYDIVLNLTELANLIKILQGKVIDEFVKKICEKYTEEERKGNYKQYCGEIKQNIADIAEQLKGEEDERHSRIGKNNICNMSYRYMVVKFVVGYLSCRKHK